ncbi:hypothetical protein [Aeromonas phage AerS_266]|nr:hypothetical protein [Aeromonas phage AerS_266]
MSEKIIVEPLHQEGLENIDQMDHGKLIEFLTGSFKYATVGGQRVIQTPDGLFVEHVLMEEDYFVNNWLVQFAIHQVGDKNYFNMEEWSVLTDGFTKGVIVINEQKEPVLLIRKFTDMGLSQQGTEQLNFCGSYASHANHAQEQERDELVKQFALQVKSITENDETDNTITGMIPLWYYRKHNVDPKTLQQVIYIRDNFKFANQPIDPDGDIIKKVEKILFTWNTENTVTNSDKAFVLEITDHQFNFDWTGNLLEPQQTPSTEEKVTATINPFED